MKEQSEKKREIEREMVWEVLLSMCECLCFGGLGGRGHALTAVVVCGAYAAAYVGCGSGVV